MTTLQRTFPGMASLLLSLASGMFFITDLGQPKLFMTMRLVSLIFALAIPLTFFWLGNLYHCRTSFVKTGAILLSIGSAFVIASNLIFIVRDIMTSNPSEGFGNDIGGMLLTLLGLSELVLVSLIFCLVLPLQHSASKEAKASNPA